jgi:hypothetical protein
MNKTLKTDNNDLLEKNNHFIHLLKEKENSVHELTDRIKDLEVFSYVKFSLLIQS